MESESMYPILSCAKANEEVNNRMEMNISFFITKPFYKISLANMQNKKIKFSPKISGENFIKLKDYCMPLFKVSSTLNVISKEESAYRSIMSPLLSNTNCIFSSLAIFWIAA